MPSGIQTMNDQPWYKKGLKFRCIGCGRCCTGDPGYVWVSKSEIEALAAAIGVDVPTFEQEFIRRVGNRHSLVEFPNGDCVFFDNQARQCTVYLDRPKQCRTWPFWESNVSTSEDWSETCRACPGSGQGPSVPMEQIEAHLRVIKV